jgi:hypothetical protein
VDWILTLLEYRIKGGTKKNNKTQPSASQKGEKKTTTQNKQREL